MVKLFGHKDCHKTMIYQSYLKEKGVPFVFLDVHENEAKLLKRFARKLDVTEQEYEEILKDSSKYPLHPLNSADERLETMLDLFKLIFADHEIDDEERALLEKYAIGLGYSHEMAVKLIKRSIEIFTGGLDLEDYRYLLNKK